jgi:hypothetical protein
MVASQADIASALDPQGGGASDPEPAAKVDEQVLQLPNELDPKKTMYASEEEIRKEMAAHDEPVVDLPPLAPEPPKFSEPDLMPPVFGDSPPASPPPSPFAASNEPMSYPTYESPFSKTTPPIPSPFDKPKAPTYDRPASYSPPEPEPSFGTASPLEEAPAPIEAAASAPVQNWEPNEPMQNAPVSAAPQGQNKTLAIVSLVAGILGVTLCCGTILPSLVAIVTGFMARGKASSDPAAYGGAGLALGGLITGVLGLLGGIAYLIFVFFFGGLQLLMQGAR